MERAQETEPADLTVETEATSAAGLLDDPRLKAARRTWYATGFDPLDDVLEGGIRPQDLVVVGGRPGVGKTVVTLQWARSMAIDGQTAVHVSYEHDERYLLWRLLLLEVRGLMAPGPSELVPEGELRTAVERVALGVQHVESLMDLDDDGLLGRAAARVRSYADRLLLARASGSHTDLAALDRLLAKRVDGDSVLFLDYLQKVPNGSDVLPQVEHLARVSGGLKELALAHDVAVVTAASTDAAGLTSPRARLHHLRGSEAIAYEADVVVMLNDKSRAVSKAHRAYDPVRARGFHDRVVLSIEKNRRGKPFVDLEFAKDFTFSRFDPEGAYVGERLVDEVLGEE